MRLNACMNACVNACVHATCVHASMRGVRRLNMRAISDDSAVLAPLVIHDWCYRPINNNNNPRLVLPACATGGLVLPAY